MKTEEQIEALALQKYSTPYGEANPQTEAFIVGYKAALSGTEAMKVLESLTPGGSEYYNDPKACADFIRDNRDGLHRQIIDLTRKLKAGTERVECYLPVSVEDELPDESTFYNCIVEPTKNNLNDTANRFFDKGTNYFLVGNSDDHRQVTHWLKKTVLTVVREREPSKDYSISENGEITK